MINNNKFWKKYNLNKNKLIKKIVDYNNKFKFNFIEKGHYNHTRDIFALVLSNLDISQNKKISVLDFGSNLLTLSNLNNKINTSGIDFTIYDPFSSFDKKKIKIKNIKYKIINDLDKIYSKKFHMINFASSAQYQKDFIKNFNSFDLIKTKYILFTATPFSLGKTYESIQSNHTNLTQIVYSFDNIVKKLKSKKFKLIFKSKNDKKYIACKDTKFKTFSLNLIFKK